MAAETYQGVVSRLMAILRSPATVPGSEVLPGSVLSLVMLMHHLSVLRHLHLPPDEHQHEQDHCRVLLELGAEHDARILIDDAKAEAGADGDRKIVTAGEAREAGDRER